MYEYYKPRTLAEMRKDLAEANLVSEIGGTRYGAKIDPNDPYFAEKISNGVDWAARSLKGKRSFQRLNHSGFMYIMMPK